MTVQPETSRPAKHRYQVRYSKRGDLRWIGHRDLMRCWERLLRRAGLELAMSEGFHPKPRLHFPAALAVGIEGLEEVLEVELVGSVDPATMCAQLRAQAPDEMTIAGVRSLGTGCRKARLAWSEFRFPVPANRQPDLATRLQQMLSLTDWPLARTAGKPPVDARKSLGDAWLADQHVHFRILATPQASLRPRDLLDFLRLSEVEVEGGCLTRTKVELA